MSASVLAKSFLPTSAVLEMGYACNLKCLFCSCPWENSSGSYIKGRALSLSEWKRHVSRLVEMGITDISYTGGEPSLFPYIYELIQYVSTLQSVTIEKDLSEAVHPPRQFFISNGQNLTREDVDLLVGQAVSLSLSLPGLKTYEALTGHPNPDYILDLFQYAKKLGARTTVNVTVTKINLHELSNIISMALLHGADTLLLNRFCPAVGEWSVLRNSRCLPTKR